MGKRHGWHATFRARGDRRVQRKPWLDRVGIIPRRAGNVPTCPPGGRGNVPTPAQSTCRSRSRPRLFNVRARCVDDGHRTATGHFREILWSSAGTTELQEVPMKPYGHRTGRRATQHLGPARTSARLRTADPVPQDRPLRPIRSRHHRRVDRGQAGRHRRGDPDPSATSDGPASSA